MGAVLGWTMAVAAIALGYAVYVWPGVAKAISLVVFWLLLQFSRAMRVMRIAGQGPKGLVPSAVMLHAKLHAGMTLLQVIGLTWFFGFRVNGVDFIVPEAEAAAIIIALAAGEANEEGLTRWIRDNWPSQ